MTDFTTNIIFLGTIVVVGLFGNAYCIRQLRSSNLRRFVLSWYLLALAMSDSGFILSLSMLLLYNVGFPLVNLPVVCQLTHYTSYLCSFLSSWYIVALSLERCFAVYTPFRSYTKNSRGRSKVVVVLITSVGLILNSWPLFVFRSNFVETYSNNIGTITKLNESFVLNLTETKSEYQCDMIESSYDYYKSLSFFDTMISCTLPLSLMVILNLLIIRRIFISKKLRRTLTNDIYLSRSRLKPYQKVNKVCTYKTIQMKEKKVTLLLLAIPLVHIILNVPNYLYRLILAFFFPIENNEEKINSTHSTVDMILTFIFYTQYSINFVLYSISNSQRDKTTVTKRKKHAWTFTVPRRDNNLPLARTNDSKFA